MQPRFLIAGLVGAAVFAMSLATFRWNLPSFAVSSLLALLAGWLTLRWNLRLDLGGLGPAARERVAMQVAWRKGGRITPEQLARVAGMSPEQARQTLELLASRDLCRKEGAVYVFYPKRA
ncbi:hypothetical protein Mterra_00089 [Calidithermus terrae]|uniref:HTH marR-type domain-containing protein n=1 Tax=Calidithermus terrae TaxID=1408545 RepID=A0A399F522_9DEIN|nr:hypothetical protein [Calidithermus terrae]RIH90865.1 hypothetical protein Mterra_00089 [Calidithermus terrae]